MSELSGIYNFIQIDDTLATAGQPTPDQMPAIKANGYQVVINLASGKTKHDVQNEGNIMDELGLTYYHLPVDWENPTKEDLRAFFDTMQQHRGENILVHCIANMRVTAFIMLYRIIRQGVDIDTAQAVMHTIWNPDNGFPIWQDFIQQALDDHSLRGNV